MKEWSLGLERALTWTTIYQIYLHNRQIKDKLVKSNCIAKIMRGLKKEQKKRKKDDNLAKIYTRM